MTTTNRLPPLSNPYIEDVLGQPAALERTLDALERPLVGVRDLANGLRSGKYSRLILTGMGSSLAALNHLLFRLTPLGHCPLLVETSELVHEASAIMNESTVLVVVSQSGRTAEVVRLLETVGHRPLVAITNDPDSPLAQRATFAYITAAGNEHSVACKTYVTALAGMALLTADLVARPRAPELAVLRTVADAMRGYLEHWQDKAMELADRLGNARSLVVCGRGHSLCSCQAGALVLREAARIHAEGVSGAQFRHGHMEMIQSGAAMLLFRGHGETALLQDKLANDIRSQNGHVVVIGDQGAEGAALLPSGHTPTSPFLEILPVQLASIGLALTHGLQPGVFSAHPKVQLGE